MNLKILIVFATREGQTAKIAERLAFYLEEKGVNALSVNAKDTQSLEQIELASFNLVVLGGSMHAGRIEPELINFIRRNATVLETKHSVFFLVLLSAASEDPELKRTWLADAEAKLRASIDVRLDHLEFIAGALTYSKYSRPVRWLMKRIAAKAGAHTDTSSDYEYTDWAQVKRFAQKLILLANG